MCVYDYAGSRTRSGNVPQRVASHQFQAQLSTGSAGLEEQEVVLLAVSWEQEPRPNSTEQLQAIPRAVVVVRVALVNTRVVWI